MIKRFCDFIEEEPPDKFDRHSHCGFEDITFLIYHVTVQNKVIKGPSDWRKNLIECNNLAKFGIAYTNAQKP